VNVALGTDVGGGGSFSQLHMMGEAYKVGQLQGDNLDPLQALHLATLGAARALHIDGHVGNLAPGKEADFVVLDLSATPLLARRTSQVRNVGELLFVLSILADDRAVERTYLMGEPAHVRARCSSSGGAIGEAG
jgi:guanine deaminase